MAVEILSSVGAGQKSATNGVPTASFSTLPLAEPSLDPLGDLRVRQQRSGQWGPAQMAGRRWPMACVSLEITQRCNLDCTLCYLSEIAEAVRDIPIEEVFRRIDLIARHYGPKTDVQVSGGEPTLRRGDELVAIVRHIVAAGMRATLFTNGIKATRALLEGLAAAGLTDVAFHVDMTQQRQGYHSESDLNRLRDTYIERARGLPISVFFNTTVHAPTFNELPMLSAYFASRADVVRMASFQLQADTGRGVLGARAERIDNASVARQLSRGVAVELNFNVLAAGHRECNQLAVMLVINGRAYDAFEDVAFVQRFMRETARVPVSRGTPWRSGYSLFLAACSRPRLLPAALRWAMSFAWKARRDLIAGRGRVHKLSFFTHNFMDACRLDPDRIDACVFMAITQDGPLSMCAYNADRDAFLLRPLMTTNGTWEPLHQRAAASQTFPIKFMKGRSRVAALRP